MVLVIETITDKSGTHTILTVIATTTATTAATTKGSDDSNSDDMNTAKPEDTKKSSHGATKTTVHHSQTFPPDSPPGGVSMKTPATTAIPTPLYKIGDWVTFSWNYTSLLGDPTAVDVLISCSTATSTWTLTSNMTFKTDAHYLWDTNKQASDSAQPLLVELYTLLIKDSDAAVTDVPSPGYLGAYSGLTFGLYTAQPYTDLANWDCVGCSSARSNYDRHLVVVLISTALITILSFTWFVSGLGLE